MRRPRPLRRPAPVRATGRAIAGRWAVVAGRSNREIAKVPFVRPRTVQRHVANAYAEIGAHNKADATAFALRHRVA